MYKSYFTYNTNEHSSSYGANALCFRNYKEYVYFTLPEYMVTGKGQRDNLHFACCIGRIHKESGEKKIIKTVQGYECGKFSIYNDIIYIWGYDDYEEEYSVLGFDMINNKTRTIAKFKGDDSLYFVLKNRKGSLVYLLCSGGTAYIKEADGTTKNRVDGIDNWDGAMVGYNERYLYYKSFGENVQYYRVDLDTMSVTNMSVELEDIIADREIYLMDCKSDILYVKDFQGENLTAIDWKNQEVWGVMSPDVSKIVDYPIVLKKYFNGEYWICLLSPNDKTPMGVNIGIVCYDQAGNRTGMACRNFDGYTLDYHILFSFEEVICGTLEVLGLDVNQYIKSGANGSYDWFYRMFYKWDEKLKAGKLAFREYYC